MYHKWQSYDVLFLKYGVQQTELFVILDHFLPFYSPNNPKNQNFQKMKKILGDIIILRYYHYHCNINDNHMMYGSWDMKHDRQNFLSFWTVFCPFIPLKNQKIKILKKWKKSQRYYHFTHVFHKRQLYDVWFLRYRAGWTEFFLILDHFWRFYLPKNQKIKILKKWKNCLEIL